MSFVSPSLFDNFKKKWRYIIEKYTYIEDVIHIYEPYIDNQISYIEHIEVLISYFPKK